MDQGGGHVLVPGWSAHVARSTEPKSGCVDLVQGQVAASYWRAHWLWCTEARAAASGRVCVRAPSGATVLYMGTVAGTRGARREAGANHRFDEGRATWQNPTGLAHVVPYS